MVAMGWKAIWKNLSLPLREEAGEALLAQYEEVGDQAALLAAHDLVARGCRVPRKRLERKSRAQRAKFLARARPADQSLVAGALRQLHLRNRKPLLGAFLDALGVEHREGQVVALPDEPAPVDALERAIRTCLGGFPRPDCELYWDVLQASGHAYWTNLLDARRAVIAAETEFAADPPPPKVERPVVEPVAPVGFSPLDRMVQDAVVASVARSAGALAMEDLREAVDEFVALNTKRVGSYHHVGFLDALAGDGEISVAFPEADDARRGWYLAGAVEACARRAEHARILDLLDRHPATFAQYGLAAHPAFRRVVPPLVAALSASGRAGEAATLLHPKTMAALWSELASPLLEVVAGFLRRQQVDAAEPLLDLLEQAGAADGELLAQLRRRRAHCLRLRRKWSDAESLLREMASDDDGALLADRGLVACRLRGLVDVALPSDPAERASFAGTLEAGREWFAAAAQAPQGHGHGDFCLGVLHLARDDVDVARPHLRRAVAEMAGRPATYRELGILGRAELYLAFAESRAMDVARAPAAFALLARSLEDQPQEAPDLVRATVENLALLAPRRAREFLTQWRDHLGDGFLDIACQAQFLRDDPELRELVRQRAARTTRSAEQRFADHESLLAAAIATGDADAAADGLDALEGLADELPSRFLDLLGDRDRCGTLWNADDVALARARVLRGQGRLAEAGVCLRDVAFRVLRDGGWDAPRQAQELLELIESFGVEPETELKAAVAAAQRTSPPAEPAVHVPRGKVLFVGGNETQERYDEPLRAWVAERYQHVDLVLKHPGWESTWARQLKRMESDVAGCDAMVIMRFVRTQLGRALRRRCNDRGIRWTACTGHGLDSIRRAVEAAVEVLPHAPA